MLICKFGSAAQEEIKAIYPHIPGELVSFLTKYNGGETPETSFAIGNISSNIVAFYGVGDVKFSYSDVDMIQLDGHTFLPIAFDSFGNQIVTSLPDGKIAFWDHEKPDAIQIVADNLKDFLTAVESKPIEPKHMKSVEEREQELIDRGKGANITDALRSMWQSEIDKYSKLKQQKVEL